MSPNKKKKHLDQRRVEPVQQITSSGDSSGFSSSDPDALFENGTVLACLAKTKDVKPDEIFAKACEYFQKATEIKPDCFNAFFHWGMALSDWAMAGGPDAVMKFRAACEKFQCAAKLQPNNEYLFFYWGTTLCHLAGQGCPDAEQHYALACDKYRIYSEIVPNDYKVLYNWGCALGKWGDLSGPEAEKYYRDACEKFQNAIEFKPDCHEAFCNWGLALGKCGNLGGPDAEKHYCDACDKFQRASEINPGKYEAFDCWGKTILNKAKFKDGQEKGKLYQEAEEILLKAEEIKTGTGAYNLACLFNLRGDEEKCKEWLENGEEAKTLPIREHAMNDEDLASVRDKDWFKAILWKGEQ